MTVMLRRVASVLEAISEQVVVPVLRSSDADEAVATARACAGAGMTVIELTRSTPDVERAIERLTGEDGLCVGLGTVTDHSQIGPAVAAGASFVVSFCAPEAMVQTARDHEVTAIPGAFTPSELHACQEAAAEAIKLFPASALSPRYVREVRAVMPELRLMATGGLNPTLGSLRPWLAAGVWAVGIGGALGTVAEVGHAEVRRRARLALQACRTSSVMAPN